MRKGLVFVLLLLLLYLLGSFFMPTQLILKKHVIAENNKKVVYNIIQDLETLQSWTDRGVESIAVETSKEILLDLRGKRYRCSIDNRTFQDSLVLIAKNVENNKKIKAIFNFKELEDKLTEIHLKVEFPQTLLPSLRYTYGLNKDKIAEVFESLLHHIKRLSEQVHYERYSLSRSIITQRDEIVYSFPKRTTVLNIDEDKKQEIDSLLLEKLHRYKLLDTTKTVYLQYSYWTDSLVKYNICIPLLKNPSSKQLLWLHGGRVDTVKGRYYSAIYKGTPQDLPLAWDSLYSRLNETNNQAEGFPLEEMLQKTDSTEIRKLLIRLR